MYFARRFVLRGVTTLGSKTPSDGRLVGCCRGLRSGAAMATSSRLLALIVSALAAADATRSMSRRGALALAGGVISSSRPAASSALAPSDPRECLLRLIDADADEESVLAAIDLLVPLDPSKGRAASSAALGGKWELLWSAKAEAFSPLLGLPRAIRPQSVQLLGDAAEGLVGAARVANRLNFPFDALSLLLSSGVRPSPGEDRVLEILPPFRFEVLAGGARVQLVEAGSDADFRALNARDTDAQAAPRNRYEQRYLETTGAAGDLRISEVISGDPVIVGSVFVHRRIGI